MSGTDRLMPRDILGMLEGVRGSSPQWEARCPAHDDRNASLSLSIGSEGRVLLHCHAGCAVDAVCSALGLLPRQLMGQATRVDPTATDQGEDDTYDYVNLDGELLFQVVRKPGKQFRQRRPDGSGGWLWNLNGVPRVLFRLPETTEAAAVGRTIYIAEGEKDVLALESLGMTATCNSGGAGKWKPEYSEALKDARVVILPDHDQPGRDHGAQVAEALSGIAEEVTIVDLAPEDAPKGYDVCDWVRDGGTARDLVRLVEAAQRDQKGRPGSPANPIPASAIAADPDFGKPMVMVVPRMAAPGRLTMFSAREKAGKTTTIAAAMAAVTQGWKFLGEVAKEGTVLLLSLENHRDDVVSLLASFGADLDRVLIVDEITADPHGDLKTAIDATSPVLVVIDTLSAFLEVRGIPDDGDNAGWTAAVAPIARIAHSSGISILLSHHARKTDGKYRGATAIGGNVDMILEMVSDDERGTRKVEPKGRWRENAFEFRLMDAMEGMPAYLGLCDDSLALETRILQFVQANPDTSMRKVCDGVSGNTKTIQETIRRLVRNRVLQDTGTSSGMCLRAKAPENPHGHWPDTPETRAGHTNPVVEAGGVSADRPPPVGRGLRDTLPPTPNGTTSTEGATRRTA